MNDETVGVVLLFGLFVVGAAVAAYLTYAAFGGPTRYWRP